MEIRQANHDDILNLYVFNQRVFPEKQVDIKNYVDFWLSKDTNALSNILLLLDDNGNIAGQVFDSTMKYFYKGNLISSVWGFDLIVEEKYRRDSWGIDLILSNFDLHPNLMATGSGPLALGINMKFGMKWLGEIRKYVGVSNPLFLFSSYKKKPIPINKYPLDIIVDEIIYRRIDTDKLPSFSTPFNDDLLEIGRDFDFLKWRFFNKLHHYAFYIREDKQTYFVLRSISVKGFRVMELVDFRCNNTEGDFESIYKAAAKITHMAHLPAIVCGSSLATFDKVLEKHKFKSIGRPRPILGFVNCDDRKIDIETRLFCFVTLADSDGETNWM